MTRPFSRDYTATGESLIYIFAHRTGSALYSVAYVIIFDGLATAVKWIVGIVSDIWHSDYRYARYVAGLLASGITFTVSVIVGGLVFLGALVKSILFNR